MPARSASCKRARWASNRKTSSTCSTEEARDPMAPRRKIHRSGLTMPINNPRFVNAAWTRGCDGFTLDLEDSVPQAQKAHARTLVQHAIQTAAQGGGEVEVRINQSFIQADV